VWWRSELIPVHACGAREREVCSGGNMSGPSPRYIAEHMILPRFMHEAGAGAVLDAIEQHDADFFIPVWMQAGFRFTPRLIYLTFEDLRVGILTFPAPREPTEGFLGVFVAKPGDSGFFRYFVWETSVGLDGAPGTVIGEWRDSKHINHGAGPPQTGNLPNDAYELAKAVLATL
jgi:hypothetical protein